MLALVPSFQLRVQDSVCCASTSVLLLLAESAADSCSSRSFPIAFAGRDSSVLCRIAPAPDVSGASDPS